MNARPLLLVLLCACDGLIVGTLTPSSPPPGDPTQPAPADLGPFGAPVFRRLTRDELRASWARVVGADVVLSSDVSDVMRSADNLDETSTTAAAAQGYASTDFDPLNTQALTVAHAAMATLKSGATCTPSAADDACVSTLIEKLGRRAYRRPLLSDEHDRLLAVSVAAAAEQQDVWSGVEYALAALLESPNLLYVAEQGERTTDPQLRLTAYELAARMAFALTSAPADDVLLDAAANGELETEVGIAHHVTRLLDATPVPLGRLLAEVYSLDAVDAMSRDATIYPLATPTLGHAFRRELELSVNALYTNRASYRGLFGQSATFINDELADIYQLPKPGTSDFVASAFPDTWERRGVFGKGAYLSLTAGPKRPSPTQRGRFVLQRMLCKTIPLPPAGVNTSLDGTMGATARERLSEHATNPSCSGCHAAMDGVGLSLENFDSIAMFRSQENAETIDDSGVLEGTAFHGARELSQLIEQHPKVLECALRELTRLAAGRQELPADQLATLATTWEQRGGTLAQLPTLLFASPGFRSLGQGSSK